MPIHAIYRALMLLGIAGLLAGCGGEAAAPPRPAPEAAYITVAPQKVTFTTELPGRTSPYRVAEVRPQVGGIVQKRAFTEGSFVKSGDVLYQIDPATFRAVSDTAEANLKIAQANLTPAKLKAERYAELVKVNAVSRQENEDAQAAAAQAAAQVGGSRAAARNARIDLERTSVRAPISGHIGKSSVTDGALVTANQADPLATIQQLDPMYVDVTQSTAELARLRRALASGQLKQAENGAQVTLTLEDGSAYPHPGELQFTDVTVDQGTGAVTVRAVFPNPDQVLLPGMYVRAHLTEGEDDAVILIPQRGVMRDATGQAQVYVIGEGNIAERRLVTTGRAINDAWQITAGLKPGERVVLEGLQRLRPGAPVTPVALDGAAQGASAQNTAPRS